MVKQVLLINTLPFMKKFNNYNEEKDFLTKPFFQTQRLADIDSRLRAFNEEKGVRK